MARRKPSPYKAPPGSRPFNVPATLVLEAVLQVRAINATNAVAAVATLSASEALSVAEVTDVQSVSSSSSAVESNPRRYLAPTGLLGSLETSTGLEADIVGEAALAFIKTAGLTEAFRLYVRDHFDALRARQRARSSQ